MNAENRRDGLSRRVEKMGYKVGHGCGEQRMGEYVFDLSIEKDGKSISIGFPMRDFNARESGYQAWIKPGDKINLQEILSKMS